jgi:hypothetical protein
MSRVRAARLFAAAALLSACSSTQMVETWRDPAVQPFPLHRTLAVFMTKDVGARRIVEDRLAKHLPGGVASYRVIADDMMESPDAVKGFVDAGHYDGAVMLRVLSVQQEIPAAASPDFYGYWGYWRYAYDPGAYATGNIYSIEATLHSFRDQRLVWTGKIETVDPQNTARLAERSIKATTKSLRHAGFIQ